jgi:hypothetical protein
MDTINFERARARKNLRTGLLLGALALASLTGFVLKIWQLA